MGQLLHTGLDRFLRNYCHADDLCLDLTKFATNSLERLEGLPVPADPDAVPGTDPCVVHRIDDHWGVYGVSVFRPIEGTMEESRWGWWPRPALFVDPLWLDVDLRETDARVPWLPADEAPWARRNLEMLLGTEIRSDFVFQAVLPPRRFTVATGDRNYWPDIAGWKQQGTLGPPVTYTNNGITMTGYLTAGHVAPEDDSSPTNSALVEIDGSNSGTPNSVGRVKLTMVPRTLGSGAGRRAAGDLDAAIVVVDPAPTRGIGPAGSAGEGDAVTRAGIWPSSSAWVQTYIIWVGSSSGALWKDCYGVQCSGSFAQKGDSGSAIVAASGDVVGIVVGGSGLVPGCQETVTYVQDIATITADFNCTVIP